MRTASWSSRSTPQTDPADAVDVTFATDNYEAGVLIGQWATAKMGDAAADAVIGMINIDPSQPVVGVKRNQGFLEGFGIDNGDPTTFIGTRRPAHRRPGVLAGQPGGRRDRHGAAAPGEP